MSKEIQIYHPSLLDLLFGALGVVFLMYILFKNDPVIVFGDTTPSYVSIHTEATNPNGEQLDLRYIPIRIGGSLVDSDSLVMSHNEKFTVSRNTEPGNTAASFITLFNMTGDEDINLEYILYPRMRPGYSLSRWSSLLSNDSLRLTRYIAVEGMPIQKWIKDVRLDATSDTIVLDVLNVADFGRRVTTLGIREH